MRYHSALQQTPDPFIEAGAGIPSQYLILSTCFVHLEQSEH